MAISSTLVRIITVVRSNPIFSNSFANWSAHWDSNWERHSARRVPHYWLGRSFMQEHLRSLRILLLHLRFTRRLSLAADCLPILLSHFTMAVQHCSFPHYYLCPYYCQRQGCMSCSKCSPPTRPTLRTQGAHRGPIVCWTCTRRAQTKMRRTCFWCGPLRAKALSGQAQRNWGPSRMRFAWVSRRCRPVYIASEQCMGQCMACVRPPGVWVVYG